MEIIQRPKGTNDIYDDTGRNVLYIRNLVENIAKNYNYSYFRTPTFERTEVFKRGVGDTTDIVQKETYDFVDRGDRNMTLRPEGTAAIVRSIIENKLYVNGVNKVWYFMPMVFIIAVLSILNCFLYKNDWFKQLQTYRHKP